MALSLEDRIKFIKGLQSPSTEQALLLRLHESEARMPSEDKLLQALIRAEMARDRAESAKAAATKLHRAAHQTAGTPDVKRVAAERRARQRRLVALGMLIDLAGLQDKAREDVLGLLLAGRQFATQEQWTKWRLLGAQELARTANLRSP